MAARSSTGLKMRKIPKLFLLDCKTTGLSPHEDRIIELTLQPCTLGQPVDSMRPLSMLVNPDGVRIGPEASTFLNVCGRELDSADSFPVVWSNIIASIDACIYTATEVPVIVARNAQSTASFLRAELDRRHIPRPKNLHISCALAVARNLWPGKLSRWEDLAKAANVPDQVSTTGQRKVKSLAAVLDYMNSYSVNKNNVDINAVVFSTSVSLASFKNILSNTDSVPYAVGRMLASADVLLSVYSGLEKQHKARNNLVDLLQDSKMRVYRIYSSIDRYSRGMNKKPIPSDISSRTRWIFNFIRWELGLLVSPSDVMGIVQRSHGKLRTLEHRLKLLDFTPKSLREQIEEVTEAVLTIDRSLLGHEITGIIETIHRTLVTNGDDHATSLLPALLKSGLSKEKKLELANIARNDWEGWKINRDDLEFARKKNGDRVRIAKGAVSDVYAGRMKLRDENDNIIAGEVMEVAVKEFAVLREHAEERFTSFFREVFLQKHARHPCIVRTFGGYWPDPKELDDDDEFEPFIVMEPMTCNLTEAQDRQLLTSMDSKRRILRDVAEGIAHLHSRGIVHRDIKPQNVLMRVLNGEIVGNAKICNFYISRKAEETHLNTNIFQRITRPMGTWIYMPPEAFSKTGRGSSKRARDIWSFGVLMCEVLVPGFLNNIVRNHPGGVHENIKSGKFAKEVTESAQTILCDRGLKELAVSCLSLDAKLRPRIEDIYEYLKGDVQSIGWNMRVHENFLDEVDFISEQARLLRDALSKSELPIGIKLELSEMARKVWQGWKINSDDLTYVKNRNGDRKRIGVGAAATVYLARMKLRCENDNIIPGEQMEVAVKEFAVPCSNTEQQFPLFVKEVFLQKYAYHPCIVQTLGGYWPDPGEFRDEDVLQPYIVMESMTHNLGQVEVKKLLKSLDSKRRILCDVARGIAHLHSRGIVHRDIKPENVVMNIDEDEISGSAKICDFGVSRMAEEAYLTATMQTFTRPSGTSAYMPPEAFISSAQDVNAPARDIWSFGVLMCEVLVPNFLANLVREHSEGLHALAMSGKLAKIIAEAGKNISTDNIFVDLVTSCLSLNPDSRPWIDEVLFQLQEDVLLPSSVSEKRGKQFPLPNLYSRYDFGWDRAVQKVKQLLFKFSRIGVSNAEELELSEMAGKVWPGWKVNFDDIEYVKKRNKPTEDKLIGFGGFGKVYLARMKLRDKKDRIIDGEPMEVAVKKRSLERSRATDAFPDFLSEMFFQKYAQHPCIVRILGGYWPDPGDEEDEEYQDPCFDFYIVMERMDFDLSKEKAKKLLKSMESKQRILRDVAAGLTHLHSHGIVHRDIKPENVLVSVAADGTIEKAKICDFGSSSMVKESDLITDTMQPFSRPPGTRLYMPPEAFNSSTRDANDCAQDIWSFGVLICVVLVPKFLANIAGSRHVHELTENGQFARKVAESAGEISCDRGLKDVAISCLSVDPKSRPSISAVLEKLP